MTASHTGRASQSDVLVPGRVAEQAPFFSDLTWPISISSGPPSGAMVNSRRMRPADIVGHLFTSSRPRSRCGWSTSHSLQR
jgi:hypothetical protein